MLSVFTKVYYNVMYCNIVCIFPTPGPWILACMYFLRKKKLLELLWFNAWFHVS